jgi:hypothetical protein
VIEIKAERVGGVERWYHVNDEQGNLVGQMCPGGVHGTFLIRNRQGYPNGLTFVFSKGKRDEAAKISFEYPLNSWEPVNYEPADEEYELYLDGLCVGTDPDIDKLVRDLWEEGYNYVRCEIHDPTLD